MLPYIIITLFLFILTYYYDIRHNKYYRKEWEVIAIIVLILFSGLRYHIGIDSVKCEYDFNNYTLLLKDIFKSYEFRNSSQPLWLLLMSAVKTIFGSFVAFQFIHAITFNGLLLRFLRRATDKVFTCLLLFFLTRWWNYNFEVLREAISVVLFLNALLLLKDGKYIMYGVVAIIGSLFHTFAIFMFILVPIVTFVEQKYIYPILALFIVATIVLTNVLGPQTITLFLSSFTEELSDDAIKQIEAYTYNVYNIHGFVTVNINEMIEIMILHIILPILVLVGYKKDEKPKVFTLIIILYIVFSIIRTRLVIVFRFNNYCFIVLLVGIVSALYDNGFRNRQLKLIYNGLVVLFVMVMLVRFYQPDSNFEHRSYINHDVRYIPYKTIFQKPDPTREAIL